MRETFEEKLRQLINRERLENASDSPDWILVTYVSACLDAFNEAVNFREAYGRRHYGEPTNPYRERTPEHEAYVDHMLNCPCGCGGQYIPPIRKEN